MSVIIPAFNYGRFVDAAIRSALEQEHSAIEVIVIDDGSTDDTHARLARRSDITYIRQQNSGLPRARNEGLERARGKYIQFLDADDLLDSDSIRKRVEVLEAHPRAAFAVCRTLYFTRVALRGPAAMLHREWHLPSRQRLGLDLLHFNIAPPHAFLVRKESIDKHALRFDSELRACEDYDFWVRLATLEGLPELVETCFVRYRVHSSSMSKSYANQFHHDAILCRRILTLFDQGPSWIDPNTTTDYLCAMLSASTLTARRLWRNRREEFDAFFCEHVAVVHSRVVATAAKAPPSPAAYVYVAKAKATLAKMCWRDGSTPENYLVDLLRSFDGKHSFAASAIIRGLEGMSLRQLARTAAFDLAFGVARARSVVSPVRMTLR